MPVVYEPYPTKIIDGVEHWGVPCWVPKESDPERGAYIYFAKPLEGVTGIAGLVQGAPGKHTEIHPDVVTTVLEHDDPTADFAHFVVVTPGSDTVSQVVQEHRSLRKGPPGADGDTILTPDDYGTPVAKDTLAVVGGLDEFELVAPKYGGMHWPGSLTDAPAGTTATYQIGAIAITAGTYRFDGRPHVNASITVSMSSTDGAVDLVARIGSTTGPVVGRGVGVAGVQTQRITVTSGPDAGAADATNRVAAGTAATIYLMTEKQSGTATYQTSSPRYSLEFVAVP